MGSNRTTNTEDETQNDKWEHNMNTTSKTYDIFFGVVSWSEMPHPRSSKKIKTKKSISSNVFDHWESAAAHRATQVLAEGWKPKTKVVPGKLFRSAGGVWWFVTMDGKYFVRPVVIRKEQ